MIQHFKIGFQQFSSFWREIFCEECFAAIQEAAQSESRAFFLPTGAWIKILYELAATFHSWKVNRNKLVDLMTPLYYARVASFVRESWEMSSQDAESLVEKQALEFEEAKDHLIKEWDRKVTAQVPA
jgi:hypothetical protein